MILLLLAAIDPTYVVALRTEARARPLTSYDVGQRFAAMDLEVQPSLGLSLDIDRIARPTLAYMPRYVLRQLDRDMRPALLHNGSFAVPIRLSRRVTLTLREDASYGVADYASISGLLQQTGRVDSVLLGAQVATTSLRSTAQVQARLARRHTLDAGVYHSYITGIGDAGVLQTPPQRAVGGYAQYNWQFARQWRAGAVSDGTYTIFSGPMGSRIGVVEGGARVGWLYDTAAELSAMVGSAVVHFEQWRVYPYARVALTHNLNAPSGRWQLALSAQLLPFIDRFALAVYQRLETGGTVTYTPNVRVTLRAQGQWTIGMMDPVFAGQQLSILDVGVIFRAARHVTLDAGGRVLSLYQPRLQTQQPLQWVAYLGFAFDVTDG